MVKDAIDNKRVNIRMSRKLWDYYHEWSIESGVPVSAIMAMQLEKSMMERETISMMEVYKKMQRGDLAQSGVANP